MVASNSTIEQIVTILAKWVDDWTLKSIVNDLLKETHGNKSYRETLERIRDRVNAS